MTVRMRSSGRSSASRRSSSSGSPKCMKRPPLQVPIAVRVGSGICHLMVRVRDGPASGRARLRRLDHQRGRRAAVGRGAAVVGAVDGARARAAVHGLRARRRDARTTSWPAQIPVFVDTAADPEARYDVGLPLHRRQRRARARLGRGGVRARPAARRSRSCGSAATRVLVCTIPLDLGRPRARRGADRGGQRGDRARLEGALVCDLRDFGARNRVMVDAVHPTAFGQVAIAERALAVLARDGLPTRVLPSTLIALGDDALEAAARRRDLRLPAGQAGGADRVLARPGTPRGVSAPRYLKRV